MEALQLRSPVCQSATSSSRLAVVPTSCPDDAARHATVLALKAAARLEQSPGPEAKSTKPSRPAFSLRDAPLSEGRRPTWYRRHRKAPGATGAASPTPRRPTTRAGGFTINHSYPSRERRRVWGTRKETGTRSTSRALPPARPHQYRPAAPGRRTLAGSIFAVSPRAHPQTLVRLDLRVQFISHRLDDRLLDDRRLDRRRQQLPSLGLRLLEALDVAFSAACPARRAAARATAAQHTTARIHGLGRGGGNRCPCRRYARPCFIRLEPFLFW